MTVSADKIEMIEGDVMLCRDRMVVVICDATLERTTNGKGSATDFTLAELKQLETGMISSFDVNILEQIASMKNTPAIAAAGLITKKPAHFGVVS